MRTALFVWAFLFVSGMAFSQEINYQKSYQEALNISKKEHKLVFAVITTPGFPGFAAIESGLANADVVGFYNKNFVPFSTTIADTATMRQLRKFQVGNFFPCYLFIDDSGNLVYKFTGNSPQTEQYLKVANDALNSYLSGKTLTAYDERYKTGKVDAAFLKEYIAMRQDIGLYDNAFLIDRYVDFLSIGDFNNYQTVLFVLKAGPFAYGKAYSLAFTNKKIADSLYKTEPLQLRVAINNRIINNTRAEAISTKSATMANNVASFTRNSWSSDRSRGNREAQFEIVNYYKAIKDTANYFREAVYYYDSNYMRVSADSARKMLETEKANILKRGSLGVNTLMKFDAGKGKTMLMTSTPGVGSEVDPVATSLNNGAWNFYLSGTKNNQYLLKALLWSRRAVSMSPDNYQFYDTYAHILYRLDLFGDAEDFQSKAVKLAAEHHLSVNEVESLQGELKKMEEKKL